MRSRLLLVGSLSFFALLWTGTAQQGGTVHPPVAKDSLRFAVIGDSGTGDKYAVEIGQQLLKSHEAFPFDFVLMLGDNLYGGQKPKDYEQKFEKPYKGLLDAGVKFYASLGNHDDPNEAKYKYFNMDGKRYYSFKPRDGVRFFALDSNYMDKPQLDWLQKELKSSQPDWKICFFHHPLYSSGEKHGPDLPLRSVLEPLFVEDKVNLVLSGHEHFYERLKPQHGINYFILGSSAKLREGGIEKKAETAKGYADDRTFMLIEIAGDKLYYQTICRTGETVDSGEIDRNSAGADAKTETK
jgi:phosphodiesterase/alkaline phosphatase D-like protein